LNPELKTVSPINPNPAFEIYDNLT
jgi:hypothetical protein